MRGRTLLCTILGFALVMSWGWTWHELGRTRTDGGFADQRLVFLEQENRRLNGLLAANAEKQQAALEASYRSEIEKSVEKLRGLAFLKPVVYKQIPRTDLPAVLSQKLAQQVPDREFASEGTALIALGLLPPGTDLKKTYLNLLGEQIGAFYDQHSEELYTFSGKSLTDSQNRVILAHELTHALEDQHFHLARLPLESQGNDDRSLAASALVEGDATLVMNQYMLANLSSAVLKDSLASAFTTDVRQLVAAPRFLRETLVFPYIKGQEFCQALYAHGGWKALADAFHHPPSSTSQILHPERFLSEPRQEPLQIEYRKVTVNGQQPTANNVVGEFGLRQLLANWLKDDSRAAEMASDWVGDRYLVYGDAMANSYVWRCAWSSEAAAKQFMAAAQVGWETRYGIKAPEGHAPDEQNPNLQTMLSTRLPSGRELRIFQQDRMVTLEEAQSADWLKALDQMIASFPQAP